MMMVMMKETRWTTMLNLVRSYPLNISCYNYNSWTHTNLSERKKVLEVIKKSERVKKKDNEKIYSDKVPTGLKASIILYDIQQKTKKLHNPAFMLILR